MPQCALVLGKGELAQSVKMYSQLQRLDLKRSFSSAFQALRASLIAATQNAFVHTLFKTCSQLQRLDVKRSFSNTLQKNSLLLHSLKTCFNLHPLSSKQITSRAIFNHPVLALLSLQGINASCRTLFKTCSKSQSLDSKLKPSTFSAKMLGFLLSSTGLAETVVALATYSLTSVR